METFDRFWNYVALYVVMLVTWSFEVNSQIFHIDSYKSLIIMDALKCLSTFAIYFIFVHLNNNVRDGLLEHWMNSKIDQLEFSVYSSEF